jgi:predicted TIM-barrel fold metal-dependent hydrolase
MKPGMEVWRSGVKNIVDGHVHMAGIENEDLVLAIREGTGVEKMNLVSIQNPEKGTGLPQSLYMKARHPEWFFVFAGLNHAEQLSGGRVKTPGLPEQVARYSEMGCDGIKMIEGKPTARQRMNIPADDAYYADYWDYVEEKQIPIVFHVNDPEEFWEPEKLPAWARDRGWGYGPDDVQKEASYAEVDEVLSAHPGLRIIFAHFYFLSADLPRARRFLAEHPNVCFDLTPGVEMLYNMSRDPDASRAFFMDHADRIVFGTDQMGGLTLEEGCYRAGIVYRWLESEDTFGVPEAADFLLGPPEDGVIRGMSLPADVLERIYIGNWSRLAGSAPRALDVAKAVEECEFLADVAEKMSETPMEETEAAKVVSRLTQSS